MRDQALAVSGLLSRKIGGPSVYPPQPEGVWQVVYSGAAWNTPVGEDRSDPAWSEAFLHPSEAHGIVVQVAQVGEAPIPAPPEPEGFPDLPYDHPIASLGRVDILVNNAGIQHVSPVEDFEESKWDAVLAINLSSAFHLVKAVVPGMKQRRFGRILNVTSITVKQPIDNLILSNALRAAVTGMARTLASEARSSATNSARA